ncbi:uncharacterized protein LOC125448412 isoform X2 [Stegostoma tigrinum]|uniref:uncharacterized protein LOC125448412 isoform X2 n=1 Tax=Stegostoma tigrinum TaxID=3053191 RepID=UPI00202AD24A|nr:uncharacterized protein LOC125448412 isoform X2 [Stegostoma tigrinum]
MEVQALTCYSCTTQGRSCTTEEIACTPRINSCITQSVSASGGGVNYDVILKNCGMCEGNVSMHFGSMKFSQLCKSCSSNLCNNEPFIEESSKLNGLECYTTSLEDPNAISTVKCTGTQDRCVNVLAQFGGVKLEMRGCASKLICQNFDTSQMGIQLSYTPNCCETNLCNKATLLPGSGISLPILAAVVMATWL